MRFDPPLETGAFLRRYKRFFVDVRLDDGREVTAHCANTGSMRGFLEPGTPVALRDARAPGRRLDWSLELSRPGDAWVSLNTARANAVVAEALRAGRLAPLRGYPEVRPEVAYGDRSRVDFLLTGPKGRCFVEVKNVTLSEGRRALFPDAVTARGTRHLRDLRRERTRGHRAVMLYLVAREDCTSLSPAVAIDPAYAREAAAAAAAGVELLAWRARVDLSGIEVARRIPVRL